MYEFHVVHYSLFEMVKYNYGCAEVVEGVFSLTLFTWMSLS